MIKFDYLNNYIFNKMVIFSDTIDKQINKFNIICNNIEYYMNTKEFQEIMNKKKDDMKEYDLLEINIVYDIVKENRERFHKIVSAINKLPKPVLCVCGEVSHTQARCKSI